MQFVARQRLALASFLFIQALLLSAPCARAAVTLSVSRAYFRLILPSLPAAGYMTLTNRGVQPVIVTGISTSGCGMAMLHKSVMKNGMDSMVAVPAVSVPPRGTLQFAPGGYHVMCVHPRLVVGHDVLATINLQGGGRVTARFAVIGTHPPHP